MAGLPTGTVTLLFTDIEGSTPLVRRLGDGFGAVRDQHRRLLRKAVADAGGYEVECRADEFFAVFQRAKDGVAAAVATQRLLAGHAWPEGISLRVRMGLHTGEPGVEGGGYLGIDVHRAARICAAGHGGQILLSQTTRELVASGVDVRDLGSYSLAGLPAAERLFQLVTAGLRSEFPPLRAESSERRRLARRLPRRRSGQPTLVEAAWQVRRLLPDVAVPLQRPLAELGAALFTADRALIGADEFIERIDDKQLTRRLSLQRQLSIYSQQAREEAERLQTRIDCVEQLEDRRHALASLIPQLPDRLDALRREQEVTQLREHISTATDQLDQALSHAAGALDLLSFKLARTRHRGIHHAGDHYIVPYSDEHSRDLYLEFDTLTEARDFKTALRLAEQARRVVESGSMTKGGEWGAGGGTL
jgi:class 3 adenylate cyclase